MNKFGPLCAALSCAILVQPVKAQEVPPLELVVEKLGQDATICQIDEAGIGAAARSAARYNRIQLVSSSIYTLYINVNVIDAGAGCASNIRAEVYSYRTVPLENKNRFAKVVLCDIGGAGYYPKGVAMSRVSEYVKQAVERCIDRL